MVNLEKEILELNKLRFKLAATELLSSSFLAEFDLLLESLEERQFELEQLQKAKQ